MSKTSKETLSDRIAGILSTTPASFDPEDSTLDDTQAKLSKISDDESDTEEVLLSKFRKQNVDFLADVDERYAGKKGNRKSLKGLDEDSDATENDEVSDKESKNKESFVEDDISAEIEIENDDDSEESNIEDEEESDFNDEDFGNDSTISKDEGNFKHMKDSDVSSQVKKGLCVKNQLMMWESLLEMRIQLQKCLITSNKMPDNEAFTQIKTNSGQDFSNKVAETKNSLFNLLEKMLSLQKVVLNKYPETKNLEKQPKQEVLEEGDEEIPSDTEDEKSEEALEDDNADEATPKKKRKLQNYENEISSKHKTYTNYRNTVIKKWHDKTRLAVMKNNAGSHSVIEQIEHNLNDKAKLIKRTQLKRSNYSIVGKTEPENKEELEFTEEYNREIFDDDDFYHQLLRELIEVKSADLTDPVQLGRQWIQLQNMRSKMKRKIDTKATKGRKIRYAIHTKLVNFMAPIDKNLWTDEAKTELFNSLFGKNNNINSTAV